MTSAMNDDGELHEYDLDAWEVPAPPSGLADRVIAEARKGAAVVAYEARERPRTRRVLLAAGVGALVAGGAIAAVFAVGAHHAAPVHGSVVAERAQHVDLDSATAELDTGASIAWTRHGDTLLVDQPRGNASWRIGDDHLQLETAGAQIDASGASLRVEVHMQLSDVRVVGASTVVAAAVAVVTVVVYEGHVQVRSARQTGNVQPGATVEVRPGQPPGPPPAPAPVLVGDDQVEKLQKKVDDLQKQLEELEDERLLSTAAGGTAPAPAPKQAP